MDLTEPLVESLAFGLDSFGLGWVGIDYLVGSRFDLGESLVWCGLFWFDSVQFNFQFSFTYTSPNHNNRQDIWVRVKIDLVFGWFGLD